MPLRTATHCRSLSACSHKPPASSPLTTSPLHCHNRQRVPIRGERREHFEAETDIWEVFSRIAAGRKEREIDPAIAVSAVFGAEDAVLDPKIQSAGLRRLVPWATMEVLSGAGHMTPMTRPDACAAAVRAVAGEVFAKP